MMPVNLIVAIFRCCSPRGEVKQGVSWTGQSGKHREGFEGQ